MTLAYYLTSVHHFSQLCDLLKSWNREGLCFSFFPLAKRSISYDKVAAQGGDSVPGKGFPNTGYNLPILALLGTWKPELWPAP